MIEKRTKGGAKTLQIQKWRNRVEETSHVAQRTQCHLTYAHQKTAFSIGLESLELKPALYMGDECATQAIDRYSLGEKKATTVFACNVVRLHLATQNAWNTPAIMAAQHCGQQAAQYKELLSGRTCTRVVNT